jgi:hypothetical protein
LGLVFVWKQTSSRKREGHLAVIEDNRNCDGKSILQGMANDAGRAYVMTAYCNRVAPISDLGIALPLG